MAAKQKDWAELLPRVAGMTAAEAARHLGCARHTVTRARARAGQPGPCGGRRVHHLHIRGTADDLARAHALAERLGVTITSAVWAAIAAASSSDPIADLAVERARADQAEAHLAGRGRICVVKRIDHTDRVEVPVPAEPRGELLCRCGCRAEPHILARLRYIEGCVRLLDLRLSDLGEGLRVRVTSGHRCARRNATIGGSPYSRHMAGDAVDLVVERRVQGVWYPLTGPTVARWVVDVLPPGGVGLYGGDRAHVVHYDARPEQPRWAPPGADRAPRKGET